MKSAEERLQATGMFHTFAIRSRALMSGSCGSGSSGSQKKMTKSISDSGNFRANLLIAAQRAALKLVDRDLQLVLQKLSRRAGRVQAVIGQQVAIEVGPLEQVPLLVVVSDQGNVFPGRHRHNLMLFQYDNYPSMHFRAPRLRLDEHKSPPSHLQTLCSNSHHAARPKIIERAVLANTGLDALKCAAAAIEAAGMRGELFYLPGFDLNLERNPDGLLVIFAGA